MKSSPRSFIEHIVQKKGEGNLTPNDLRSCLERVLKEVAAALEVKVAFRYNDQNERRMSGELISELRSTLKRKSASTLGEPIFARLEVCSLVAAAGSHDSGPILSSGDIAAIYEDVLKLNELFLCIECEEYVSTEQFVDHEKKAFCKCGKKHIQWKE